MASCAVNWLFRVLLVFAVAACSPIAMSSTPPPSVDLQAQPKLSTFLMSINDNPNLAAGSRWHVNACPIIDKLYPGQSFLGIATRLNECEGQNALTSVFFQLPHIAAIPTRPYGRLGSKIERGDPMKGYPWLRSSGRLKTRIFLSLYVYPVGCLHALSVTVYASHEKICLLESL